MPAQRRKLSKYQSQSWLRSAKNMLAVERSNTTDHQGSLT
jgi:hypothetical protein